MFSYPSLSIRRWLRGGLALGSVVALSLAAGLALGQLLAAHDRDTASEGDAPPVEELAFRPVFTLAEPLATDGNGRGALHTASFQLPGNTRQGEPLWYMLDATIEVNFDSSAPPDAFSYVSVLTNGQAAAMVGFSREASGDQSAVRWNTRDLFTGPTHGLLLDRTMTLHLANYLQRRGVRPGDNEISLRVEHLSGGAVVTAARLLPGSVIAVSRLGPPALRLQGKVSTNRVRAGEMLTLDYRVTSQGYPATDVEVQVNASASGLVCLTAPHELFGWVEGTEEAHSIQFQALVPGHYEIRVRAQGRTGGTAQITIPVEIVAGQD